MTVDKALYILFRRQGSVLSRCFVETPPSVSVCIHKLSGFGYNGASRGISQERQSPASPGEESNDESVRCSPGQTSCEDLQATHTPHSLFPSISGYICTNSHHFNVEC
jgi:hypothetical protein